METNNKAEYEGGEFVDHGANPMQSTDRNGSQEYDEAHSSAMMDQQRRLASIAKNSLGRGA